jgi:hypothetical protein
MDNRILQQCAGSAALAATRAAVKRIKGMGEAG